LNEADHAEIYEDSGCASWGSTGLRRAGWSILEHLRVVISRWTTHCISTPSPVLVFMARIACPPQSSSTSPLQSDKTFRRIEFLSNSQRGEVPRNRYVRVHFEKYALCDLTTRRMTDQAKPKMKWWISGRGRLGDLTDARADRRERSHSR
jgi:hypothetical protein